MDSSSYLDPSTIKSQCDAAIALLQQDNDSLGIAENSITAFSNNSEIKSQSFEGLKQQLADYKTISGAIKLANESDIYDYESLKGKVGDEILDGAVILEQKNNADSARIRNEDLAATYNSYASHNTDVVLGMHYKLMAGFYTTLASCNKGLFDKWVEKEEKYDQIENDTSGLLKASESIRATIQTGIAEMSKAFVMGGYKPVMISTWRTNIAKENEALMAKTTVDKEALMQEIMNNIDELEKNSEKLSQEEVDALLEKINSLPEAAIKTVGEYIMEAAPDLIEGFGNSMITIGGKMLNAGIAGPAGSNSFIMLNNATALKGSNWLRYGGKLASAGKALGVGIAVVGFGVGMYDDINNKGKTVGQAITHNAVATGVGIGAAAITTTIATVALTTTPVGWVILGSAAVSVGASKIFDAAYDNNFLGVQDGLDWLGDRIDDGIEAVKNTAKDAIDGIGEALGSIGKAINPFSWA